MKAIVSTCVMLVAFLYGEVLWGQENKGPRIEFRQVQHDFGKVVEGTRVSHVFPVRNVGNESLVIERLEPS